jgi:hypothetical protein
MTVLSTLPVIASAADAVTVLQRRLDTTTRTVTLADQHQVVLCLHRTCIVLRATVRSEGPLFGDRSAALGAKVRETADAVEDAERALALAVRRLRDTAPKSEHVARTPGHPVVSAADTMVEQARGILAALVNPDDMTVKERHDFREALADLVQEVANLIGDLADWFSVRMEPGSRYFPPELTVRNVRTATDGLKDAYRHLLYLGRYMRDVGR